MDELVTPLDRWLFFLRHAEQLDPNVLPNPLDVPEIRWAMGDLMMISRNKQDRALYESRQKLQRDVYTALAEKLDEGRAEGRAEAVRAQVQFLQQRLRHDTIPREQLRALSSSELDNLLARLQAELDAKLGLGS